MPITGDFPRIFLSYSSSDKDFVIWLGNELNSLGHNIHLHKNDILAGIPEFEIIQAALDKAQVMLLIMTPESLQSREVIGEWMYFVRQPSKKLIPILLEHPVPPERINYMLASLQHVDFQIHDHDAALLILHQTLKHYYDEQEIHYTSKVSNVGASRTYASFTDHIGDNGAAVHTGSGVIATHPHFPVDTYIQWHKHVRTQLKILTISTGVTHLADYDQLMTDALERGVDARILLLDPSSQIARIRSQSIYLSGTYNEVIEVEVPRAIRLNIQRYANLFSETERTPGSLILHLYDTIPPCSLYVVDDRALVGFFVHGVRMTDFPVLEISLNSSLGEAMLTEFERIWDVSLHIDLAPQFSVDLIDRNRELAEPLTSRELQILGLIIAGLSNQEIANRLVVSVATVKKHINNLYSKLGVDTRTRAIVRARELGLDETQLSTPPNS